MVARGHRGARRQAPHRGDRLTDEPTAPDPGSERAHRARATVARSDRLTVAQGDRLKAYRPIPPDRRRAALEAGLSAYARGDFFEAHELLEPAWMGTSDLAERALYQGLIKLAAGYVHAVRGNPIGVARNLRGAQTHLETSHRLNPEIARGSGIDVPSLLKRIDDRLAAVATVAGELAALRRPLIDLLPGAPEIR